MVELLSVQLSLPMYAWIIAAVALLSGGLWLGRKGSSTGKQAYITDAFDPALSQQLLDFREQQGVLFGTMNQEIQNLSNMQNQLSHDTSRLAQALRGSSNVQGQWGELQLRTVLELSGMLEHVDFVQQQEIQGGLRPDVIIRLPQGRQIVVDSKAPLSAYMAAVADATTVADRQKLASKLAQNLRKHALSLGSKQYWQALAQSPDFVLMFVPNDAMLGLAAEAQPGLFDDLAKTRVLIVSPTTLIALAKTLAYAWRQHKVEAKSAKLSEHAEALYEQLSVAALEFRKMGTALADSVECYNALLTTMEGRVVPSAKLLAGQNITAVPASQAFNGQSSVKSMPLGAVVENRRSGKHLH